MAAVRKKNEEPVKEARRIPWALLGAILFGGMAILIFYVVFFAPNEGMLSGMRRVIQGLCGALSVIAPAVFIWLCVLCACRAAGKRVAIWRVVANFGLLLCLYSAVELFFLEGVERTYSVILSWADFVLKAYRYGKGGGAVGALIAAAVYPYLGAWGGLIAVIVLATLLMAITGKLGKIAKLVKKGSHNMDQRRMVRRSNGMFETDGSMLDREFDEAAARSRRGAYTPSARDRDPVAPRRSRMYNENIISASGRDASDVAYKTAGDPVKVRASANAGAEKTKDADPAVEQRPAGQARPAAKPKAAEKAADRSMAEEAADALFEIPVEDKAADAQPEADAGGKKPPSRAKAGKTGGEQSGERRSIDDLRIEPDEYEPQEADEPQQTFNPDGPLPKLKRSGAETATEEEEYNYPPIDLLTMGGAETVVDGDADMDKAKLLEETLRSFGIQTRLTGIAHGPAVTRFELQPAPGVKVSRITSLADDIALNLAAISVRIEAPIPGKAAVGVEVPNDRIETVSLRNVLECQDARRHASRIAVGLGKDNSGRYIIADIAKMPHVLIAGQTGSGKSVCINSIIVSILFRATPDEVKLILIDPKVVELSVYNGIPHLIAPVVTDPKKAASALEWAVVEMTSRYKKFAERGVRDIKGYNKALNDGEKPMPHMVIIIDELADLMMVCPGEVEDSICRLAQLARAAGMHLVIATQRPSVNVITGIIKANIPTRIAFLVASQVDSRTIIDHGGAEKLLGHGDMLYVPSGIQKPMRVQGSWVSDEEVHAVVEYIKERHETVYDEDVLEQINNAVVPDAEKEKSVEEYDQRLPEAIDIVLEAGQASVSMLQRRMRVGYARAGRLIDDMYQRGIVSEADGAKPRAVLITREQFNMMFDEDGK